MQDTPPAIYVSADPIAPAYVVSNGVYSVVIWWRAFARYRIEVSPDMLAWFTVKEGEADPALPLALGVWTGWWWNIQFYRLVEI